MTILKLELARVQVAAPRIAIGASGARHPCQLTSALKRNKLQVRKIL